VTKMQFAGRRKLKVGRKLFALKSAAGFYGSFYGFTDNMAGCVRNIRYFDKARQRVMKGMDHLISCRYSHGRHLG
jgi:hypothetical protein